jgi:hypothetical protein
MSGCLWFNKKKKKKKLGRGKKKGRKSEGRNTLIKVTILKRYKSKGRNRGKIIRWEFIEEKIIK